MKIQPTSHDTPIAPRKLKLLVTVVNREKGEFYLDFLQSFEVNFQTAMAAHGTASQETLRLLGLGESNKTVIFSVIREDMCDKALAALEQKFKTIFTNITRMSSDIVISSFLKFSACSDALSPKIPPAIFVSPSTSCAIFLPKRFSISSMVYSVSSTTS